MSSTESVWIHAEEELGTGGLLDDRHADHAIGWAVGCQKGLGLPAGPPVVRQTLDPDPAAGLAGAIG